MVYIVQMTLKTAERLTDTFHRVNSLVSSLVIRGDLRVTCVKLVNRMCKEELTK